MVELEVHVVGERIIVNLPGARLTMTFEKDPDAFFDLSVWSEASRLAFFLFQRRHNDEKRTAPPHSRADSRLGSLGAKATPLSGLSAANSQNQSPIEKIGCSRSSSNDTCPYGYQPSGYGCKPCGWNERHYYGPRRYRDYDEGYYAPRRYPREYY